MAIARVVCAVVHLLSLKIFLIEFFL